MKILRVTVKVGEDMRLWTTMKTNIRKLYPHHESIGDSLIYMRLRAVLAELYRKDLTIGVFFVPE